MPEADAFLERWDSHASALRDGMRTAYDRESDWRSGMRAALASAAQCIASDPTLAAEGFIRINQEGRVGRQRRDAAIAALAELIAGGEGEAGEVSVPPSTAVGLAGAAYGMVAARIAGGRVAEVAALVPELMFSIVLAYLGPDEAAAELSGPLNSEG
jgi:hypothetical protein